MYRSKVLIVSTGFGEDGKLAVPAVDDLMPRGSVCDEACEGSVDVVRGDKG